ncbi:hypothetical protein MBLNU230_g6924t1 [Neophaeotheca triangularis]
MSGSTQNKKSSIHMDLPATESTPLLDGTETGPVSTQVDGYQHGPQPSRDRDDISKQRDGTTEDSEEPTETYAPMPKVQVFLLCYASLVEPISYFTIFPFISEMLSRVGELEEANVGFWAGMIESLFSLVQMLLMIGYGRLADRLGRKPVLVFSLTGVSFSTAFFGCSTSLWMMVLFRCLAGTFAGSVVTVRAMLTENTNAKTQARAFSLYMFTRNLGILIGPLIGGGLANPTEQFPSVFGHVQFLKDYPYALATIVAGTICLTAAIASAFGLKETLQRKDTSSSKTDPPMSTWDVLKAPGVPIVLFIYGYSAFIGLSYTAVSPVFLFTSIERGGFKFSPQWISIFLAVAGASQALWMLLIFPPLQQRTSTGFVLRACAVAWPLFFVSFPVLNEFLRRGWTTPFWIVGPIALVLASGVSMSYACVQLCLNDVAPSPQVNATLNALALVVTSGVRAVAPALFTSIFAFGVKKGWIDGHLFWVVICVFSLAFLVVLRWLPAKAEGKVTKERHERGETS